MKKFLLLDNIRSSENVGAIFRTADAIGIDKIFLCGITPGPIDRFGRAQPKIAKAALGAELSVQSEQKETALEVILKLKEEKVRVVALEQSENSLDYKSYEVKGDTAVLLGPEVEGLSKETLSMCDAIIEIPMLGEKESLNVSVAAGIALYRLFD